MPITGSSCGRIEIAAATPDIAKDKTTQGYRPVDASAAKRNPERQTPMENDLTTIAVSGCHGFIGGTLVAELEHRGHSVRRIERNLLESSARAELSRQLDGCSAIIHCAGLTPRRRRLSEADFDLANHQFTKNFGIAAADAAVPRFVFVSSIAVVGGNAGMLTPDMRRKPVSAYGRSKAAGETALLANGGLEKTVIVRPPLVYGPDPKGDLGLLLKLCASPFPLPFGAVENRRSMIGVTNLVDALHFLATAPAISAGATILHASDGRDLSLRELITTIRDGLGRPPGLIDVPAGLLRGALRAIGLKSFAEKLLGDLRVDVSGLSKLGWRPRVEPAHDLHRMAHAFVETSARG
jgi:UDP-glucose 4-epimerase